MIFASLIIGLLTAYYYGLKRGATAAAVALGLFVVAVAVPGAMWPAYGLVAAGLIALFALGPRAAPSAEASHVRRVIGTLWSQAKRQLRRRQ